jgi:hypothetical protein
LLVGPVATCHQGNGQQDGKTTRPFLHPTIRILHRFTPGLAINNAWIRQNMLRRQDGGKEKMRPFARDGDCEKFGLEFLPPPGASFREITI